MYDPSVLAPPMTREKEWEFKIIQNDPTMITCIKYIEDLISDYLNDGWDLHGELIVTRTAAGTMIYTQALVRCK